MSRPRCLYNCTIVLTVLASSTICVGLASAQSLDNAECNIQVNGIDLIVGRCIVTEEAGTLRFTSTDIRTTDSSGLPKVRLELVLDGETGNLSYAGYNTENMSRFADLSLDGLNSSLTDVGGCVETRSFRLCYELASGSSTSPSLRNIFEAASEVQRQSVQEALQTGGYYQGAIDGKWGPRLQTH